MPNLIITKALPKIALLDEGAKVSILSVNPFTEGVIGRTSLEFSDIGDYAYTDQHFTLSWNGMSFEFTFKTSPDGSGLQLQDNDAMAEPLVILSSIIMDLSSNYYINRDFEVTGNHVDKTIVFHSRKMGEEFNIVLSNSDVDGLIFNPQTLSSKREMLPNYLVFVQPRIFTENVIYSEALGTEAIRPNGDFLSNFDIAEYFSDLLDNSFQFPNPVKNIYTHPEAVQKYFIVYGDKYGGEFKKQYHTQEDPRYIIKGGLSKLDRQLYTDSNIEYFDYGSNAQRFLTWQPLSKKTTKRTPERLYFLNINHNLIKLCITAKNRDGSTYELILSEIIPDAYTMLEFVVDYATLQIPSYKDVVSWDIYLTDADTTISEIRSYELDETPFVDARHFLFRNSLNTFDSFYTSGVHSKSVSLKRDTVDTIDLEEFTTHKSSQKHFNTKETQKFTANTGFLTKEELDHKREFLLSEDVYQIIGSTLIPILVTSTKATMFKDREHIYHLEFTYEYAFKDSHFSKDLELTRPSYLMLGDNYLVFEDGADRLRF